MCLYHGEDNLSDNLVWPWSKKQEKSEWQRILQEARGAEHHRAWRLDMVVFSHLRWMKAESSVFRGSEFWLSSQMESCSSPALTITGRVTWLDPWFQSSTLKQTNKAKQNKRTGCDTYQYGRTLRGWNMMIYVTISTMPGIYLIMQISPLATLLWMRNQSGWRITMCSATFMEQMKTQANGQSMERICHRTWWRF